MPHTWILIANGRRARFYLHDRSEGALVELAGFIYPAAAAASEPLAAGREMANSRFARQLAGFLNKAVANRRCDGVALIATGPMLGLLRPMLSPVAAKQLLGSVDSDFTLYQGSELHRRVQDALGSLA